MARNWDPSTMISTIKNVSSSLVLCCLASQVYASGFALLENNVTNLGLAYSGTAALAEDASTNYFNSAALSRIEKNQIVLGVNVIQGDFDFTASSSNVSLLPATPVPGSQTDDPGTVVAVPNFHIAARIDEDFVFGFSVTTPFGLKSEYDRDGIARYVATNSEVQTLNFSPSISYRPWRCISFGAGPDALWTKAKLEARIGTGNAAGDGFQKNHAQGWGYGWHAGALYEWRDTTRVGLHYRSKINVHAEGPSEILSPFAVTPAGTMILQNVSARVVLPESWTLSGYHEFTDKIAATADVAWTNWSRFDKLALNFTPGVSSGLDTITNEQFVDTWRFALGGIYTLNQNWLFRVGLAYDQTPTQDQTRTARIPDEDRTWVTVGAAYTLNKCWRFDFGYAHLFFRDATINESAPNRAGEPFTLASQARLAGSYDSSANIVGIQMRYDFV
ncbi:MAG: OmpP1/FadL family transporter [Candidatus Berkiella sp.]